MAFVRGFVGGEEIDPDTLPLYRVKGRVRRLQDYKRRIAACMTRAELIEMRRLFWLSIAENGYISPTTGERIFLMPPELAAIHSISRRTMDDDIARARRIRAEFRAWRDRTEGDDEEDEEEDEKLSA